MNRPHDLHAFSHFLRQWYVLHGRHELPWRKTSDPYHILVSELMLQQTQVERVIPKYQAFIARFPSVETLADASLRDVLLLWQGLGYNRRAKFLQQCAATVVSQHAGVFPQDEQKLRTLPGVGPYTASAIAAFAYNQPTVLIETNVRTIFLYHFFADKTGVHDNEILPLIAEALDHTAPREWYWALMDYGSYLKKVIPNPNRKSKQYTKQSKFAGSLRQVRGEIIRLLTREHTLSRAELQQKISSNKLYLSDALTQLISEGLIVESNGAVTLAE